MQIKTSYAISLFLDTRHIKKNKAYSVKLRVFSNDLKKAKLYSTKFEFFNEKDFNSVWKTEKTRKVHETLKLEMQAVLLKANSTAQSLDVFTFESFERGMKFNKTRKDVFSFYEQAINDYKQNKQIGTASNYDLSMKSLKRFCNKETLLFIEVTSNWLKGYEKFMLSEGKSTTTIGIYLRPLRAIFNAAIDQKIINADLYPFGRRKYAIPEPKATKKALSQDQLKQLFETEAPTPEQQKAKAFWFFSYSCNGLNVADIARLQYKNVSDNLLSFHRQKTINTKRQQAAIQVYLTDFAKDVITKYGQEPISPETLIFDILQADATPEQQHRQTQNFVRFINQHIKNFAENIGIKNVSTYTARHSYATNLIRKGAAMEFVSESLGHSNLKTTQTYFKGFENETRKQFAEKLMQF